jgi:PAS domain S-box-containing protein
MHLPDLDISAQTILDHTSDGIYVVDTTCRILYWNKTAELITGWKAEEVVGHRCQDNILVHVDRAGNKLCLPGRCPLHRCMAANQPAGAPTLVWAQTKSGQRVPVAVSVSPLRDAAGRVIGGVEVFRDETENNLNMERSRLVQQHALAGELPQDGARFQVLYRPHDLVGGDYYRIETLADGRYAFLMADVTGHGVAAALYTMTLRALWNDHAEALGEPGRFLTRLNASLESLTVGDSFTTAFAGLLDPVSGSLTYASAGHPPALLRHPSGRVETLEPLDMMLGMMPGMVFDQAEARLPPGGLLLLFSDGALEAKSPGDQEYGQERLTALVAAADPSRPDQLLAGIEQALLIHVESVSLQDDLCLLAVSRPEA